MASAKVSVLTKLEIAKAARDFRWNRQMPKWTVIVDGRELPARPLVLQAAGVPPNDPTNSHQAVAILQDRGFDVRYEGKPVHGEHNDRVLEPVSDEFIQSLRGRLKGKDSLVEAWEREHRIEKDRTTR
jgi:ribosomal protein L39E